MSNDSGIYFRRLENVFIFNELEIQFENTEQFHTFMDLRIILPSLRELEYPPTLFLAIQMEFANEILANNEQLVWRDSERLFKVIGDWIKE